MGDDERNDEQNESNNTLFDDISDTIQDHPKETEIGILIGVGIFICTCCTNVRQWWKRKQEEKRHRDAECLAQEAIQKQNAEIKDLSERAKAAEHLGIENEALIKALESEKNKEGETDEEE